MNQTPRKLHRKISLWLVVPLLVTLATGVSFRVGRAWFGISKETGHSILQFHDATYLGEIGSSLYVTVVGGGLLFLIATGVFLFFSSRGKSAIRLRHRLAGIILTIPLAASAITGIAYRTGQSVFSFSEDTLKVLMSIHQGSWLGPQLRVYYIIFLGLGLLVVIVTGLKLTRFFGKGARRETASRGEL